MKSINISATNLTFGAMFDAYTEVLRDQPGKALRLNGDQAVFLEDGEIYSATLSAAGELVMETAGSISPEAWDDERGCWDSDDSAETSASAVNSPELIDLPR